MMNNQTVTILNNEESLSFDRKARFYQEICRRIESLELAPDVVLDETALSNEFALSRPPIREAMRQLAAEGYIELAPNRPAKVKPFSYATIREFYLASPFLYTATSQLATIHASQDEISNLKEIQRNFCLAISNQNADERSWYNNRFHQAIAEMAHNEYLLPAVKRLLIDHARIGKIFYRYPAQTECMQSWDSAIEHHNLLIMAIEAHDASNIEHIIKEHMNLSHQCLVDYVTPHGLNLSFSIINN